MPCPPSSLPISLVRCSPGTTRMPALCRGGAGPALRRPIPIGSGCRRSCSSRPRSRRWGRDFEEFVARWPDVAALAARRRCRGDGRLGGARLLCPRAQPDRLREGGGRRPCGRVPRHRSGAAHASRDRRLYRRRDRGDRVRRTRGGGRRQCRARRRAPVRDSGAAARARQAIREAADSITPDRARRRFRAGDDGSGIEHLYAARPPLPALPAGPLRAAAMRRGDPEAYPVKRAKAAKPQRHGTIFWAERDGKVLLVRRPPKGLLGGMRALPTGPWTDAPPGLAAPPLPGDWRLLDRSVVHVFTHFRLELALAVARTVAHSSRRRMVADSRTRIGGAADGVRQGGGRDQESDAMTMRAVGFDGCAGRAGDERRTGGAGGAAAAAGRRRPRPRNCRRFPPPRRCSIPMSRPTRRPASSARSALASGRRSSSATAGSPTKPARPRPDPTRCGASIR